MSTACQPRRVRLASHTLCVAHAARCGTRSAATCQQLPHASFLHLMYPEYGLSTVPRTSSLHTHPLLESPRLDAAILVYGMRGAVRTGAVVHDAGDRAAHAWCGGQPLSPLGAKPSSQELNGRGRAQGQLYSAFADRSITNFNFPTRQPKPWRSILVNRLPSGQKVPVASALRSSSMCRMLMLRACMPFACCTIRVPVARKAINRLT